MNVIKLKSVKGGTVYLHCDKVLYFNDNNEESNTRGEVHLVGGEKLMVRELASKIESLMHCD